MSSQCDFRQFGIKEPGRAWVVCRNCGRRVHVRADHIGLVFANCRVEGAVPAGVGHELKKLLAIAGITATPNCSCNARAREMDARGPDWCEANIDTIVGWLREEATKRKLPFVDMAGRLLVKRAIRNARKAAS